MMQTSIESQITKNLLIKNLWFDEQKCYFEYQSGQIFSFLVARFPRLQNATDFQRSQWRLIGNGQGVHWEDIDEDISANIIFSKFIPNYSFRYIDNHPAQELSTVLESLAIDFKKISDKEYITILEKFSEKYLHNLPFVWDNLKFEKEIYEEFAWLCFDKILENKEIIVFFDITKSPFALYLSNWADLKTGLENSYTFSFYVTNPSFDFYLAYNNDLDLLRVGGEAVSWLEKLDTKIINLINFPILSDLLAIKVENTFFDLHNNFECIDILKNEDLIFKFSNESYELSIIFSDYFCEQPLNFSELNFPQNLDNFYRGRYQHDSQLFDEYEGKQCFYLDLEQNWQILAKNASILIKSKS